MWFKYVNLYKTNSMLKNNCILIVEDEDAMLSLVSYQLEDYTKNSANPRLALTKAKTLPEATEKLEKIDFDMIFLDGNLSGKPQDELPETLPFYYTAIATGYAGRIFSITDSINHREIMEELGCVHVPKNEIAKFAIENHSKIIKKTSTLAPGSPVVIRTNKIKPFGVYMGKVISIEPLEVQASDHVDALKKLTASEFLILDYESSELQSNDPKRKQLLLDKYQQYMYPIEVLFSKETT